ncbi:hypothetical protein D3C74_315360 [compost metagenome]
MDVGPARTEEPAQVCRGERRLGQEVLRGRRDVVEVRADQRLGVDAAHAHAGLEQRAQHARELEGVVGRDEVDGAAHHGDARDRAVVEPVREVVGAEPLEARPQPGVRGRGDLRLEPDEVVDLGEGRDAARRGGRRGGDAGERGRGGRCRAGASGRAHRGGRARCEKVLACQQRAVEVVEAERGPVAAGGGHGAILPRGADTRDVCGRVSGRRATLPGSGPAGSRGQKIRKPSAGMTKVADSAKITMIATRRLRASRSREVAGRRTVLLLRWWGGTGTSLDGALGALRRVV